MIVRPQKSAIKILSDVSQLDSIQVHISQLEKKIRISSKALEEWLEAKEYSRTLFLRAMKDRFNMVDIRARIAAGTDYASAQEYLHEIDLTAMVHELDAEIATLRQKPGVRFSWHLPAGLPSIRTDPVKLKVVLKNLIHNAIKFTDTGEVRVATEVTVSMLPCPSRPRRGLDGSSVTRRKWLPRTLGMP